MNHFKEVAQNNAAAARVLAAAFAAVHSEWDEVYGALRAMRRLTGVDAFGYLSGSLFADLQDDRSEIVEDRATLLQLREEAQSWEAFCPLPRWPHEVTS